MTTLEVKVELETRGSYEHCLFSIGSKALNEKFKELSFHEEKREVW